MDLHYCNPINGEYLYQFNRNPMQPDEITVNREAADPSVILYKGKYYLFASMTLSVWVSDDLVHWQSHRLPSTLPLYGYAPDARIIGNHVYFTAPGKDGQRNFYRTQDILNGPYEEIHGTIPYDDPNLFEDTDGSVYFYWGLSSQTPIMGVELDKDSLLPIGEPTALLSSDASSRGYERIGEDNATPPLSSEETEARFLAFLQSKGATEADLDATMAQTIRGMISQRPYIEGAWMSKFGNTYYLQYAFAGTQYNIYGDGVFISKSPLGPFSLAENNPYSFVLGGFFPGAGHGSTFEDIYGNLWHAATMRISVNHNFERRIGIWPAGIDADGELFCNQRYADWPTRISTGKRDPFQTPEWYLLSHKKKVTASSCEEGYSPSEAVTEDVRTWWKAQSSTSGEWLQVDLGNIYSVHAIQINFADDHPQPPVPETFIQSAEERYIENSTSLHTSWTLDGSADGKDYKQIAQRTSTDLPHDTIVLESGALLRYVKLTISEVPFEQKPCISGLRIFGKGSGALPDKAKYEAVRTGDLDMEISIRKDNAAGHIILWGHSPNKLYHSCMTYQDVQRIGALVRGVSYFIRVDSFNENGIVEGEITEL